MPTKQPAKRAAAPKKPTEATTDTDPAAEEAVEAPESSPAPPAAPAGTMTAEEASALVEALEVDVEGTIGGLTALNPGSAAKIRASLNWRASAAAILATPEGLERRLVGGPISGVLARAGLVDLRQAAGRVNATPKLHAFAATGFGVAAAGQ